MLKLGDYAQNKIVSLVLPILMLITLLLFWQEDDSNLWWSMVVIVHGAGYIHFLLGFYYQYSALRRQKNTKKLVWLFALTFLAVAVSIIAVWAGYLALLAIVAVVYFIFHGALNELTIMREQMGYAPLSSLFLPIIFYVTPFFLLSLTHPSFFFTPKLEFLSVSPQIAFQYLDEIISVDVLLAVSFIMIGLFILLVPVRLLLNGNEKSGLGILAASLITLLVFAELQPLNYVFLYFFALLFHFISFSYFYYQKFRINAPARIPAYIRQHLYIAVPLILLSIASSYDWGSAIAIHQVVFHGSVFITLAMVHNTTSFLNETWFVKFFRI